VEALRASVTSQVTPLGGDRGEVLGISVAVLADKLSERLIGEIEVTGLRDAPLEALANRLVQDRIYLQGQRTEAMLARLEQRRTEAVARLDSDLAAGSAPGAVALTLAELPAAAGGFAGRADDLAWVLERLDPAQAAKAICLAGLPGVGKSTLAIRLGAPRGTGAGLPATYCSSTCTVTTSSGWNPARPSTLCSGRSACRATACRRNPRSESGCTGRRWLSSTARS
jgi:hypothetical protein